MKNLFKIVYEGQKAFVYTPDGIKVGLITATVFSQGMDEFAKSVHMVGFDFLVRGGITIGDAWSVNVNDSKIISPQGIGYDVESVEVINDGGEDSAASARVHVYAKYDHALSTPDA